MQPLGAEAQPGTTTSHRRRIEHVRSVAPAHTVPGSAQQCDGGFRSDLLVGVSGGGRRGRPTFGGSVGPTTRAQRPTGSGRCMRSRPVGRGRVPGFSRQASSSAAERRRISIPPTPSMRSSTSPSSRPRCSPHNRMRVVLASWRAPSPWPPGSSGVAAVALVVDDRAGQLRIVGPGADVEVVAADDHPHVIDHADLGVHVDRPARRGLEVEERHPFSAGSAQLVDGPLLTDPVRRTRDPAVLIRKARYDRNQV